MKRIIAFCLALIVAITILCGCGAPMQNLGDQSNDPTTFMIVEEYMDFRIVVDTDTGVMYSVSNGGYNAGTMTLLVNADGSPKLFPAFDAMEDAPNG